MHNQQYDRHVKRIFGPSARVDGSMGSPVAAGELRILLDGHTIGRGSDFETALQDARESAGRYLSHQADKFMPTAVEASEAF